LTSTGAPLYFGRWNEVKKTGTKEKLFLRVYIPDMTEFFAWMEQSGHGYVVLRGFSGFAEGYPAHGAKEDVDLLVSDDAVLPIKARYHAYSKRRGVKCDVYSVSGHDHGGYLGLPYYPAAFASEIISTRRRFRDLFYVPDAKHHLLSLLYHITYQKMEASKIDIDDPALSSGSKYVHELEPLCAETGDSLTHSLLAYHDFLRGAGLAPSYDVLAVYVQNQFAHDVKSMFMAHLFREFSGEMNMFVIRGVAVKTGTHTALIDMLRQHYKTILVKDIPFFTRLTESGKMRGGKWRRGGRPHIAVLVFDPHPQETTEEDRKVHGYVFNSRQFVKRGFREWFTKKTGCKASANPLHSTDNEAEAVGHFPMFFSAHEQEDIFLRLKELRSISS
jgi:hypothetical protein